jgi:BolA family transcriptional regulator, general stress-responsive regulator
MKMESLIRSRLAALEPIVLNLQDDSALHAGHAGAGNGGHYRLVIVSEQFRNMSRLSRQRAVMDRVADLIPTPVHALSVQAHAPDEYQ